MPHDVAAHKTSVLRRCNENQRTDPRTCYSPFVINDNLRSEQVPYESRNTASSILSEFFRTKSEVSCRYFMLHASCTYFMDIDFDLAVFHVTRRISRIAPRIAPSPQGRLNVRPTGILLSTDRKHTPRIVFESPPVSA